METTVSTRPVVQSLGDGRAAKGLTAFLFSDRGIYRPGDDFFFL